MTPTDDLTKDELLDWFLRHLAKNQSSDAHLRFIHPDEMFPLEWRATYHGFLGMAATPVEALFSLAYVVRETARYNER